MHTFIAVILSFVTYVFSYAVLVYTLPEEDDHGRFFGKLLSMYLGGIAFIMLNQLQ